MQQQLKRGDAVYSSEGGVFKTFVIYSTPNKAENLYRVRDVNDSDTKLELSGDMINWPDFIFLSRNAAIADAEARRADIERRRNELLSRWEHVCLRSKQRMMDIMFRNWRKNRFHADELWSYEMEFMRDDELLELKEERIIDKIREYYGVDLRKE